MAKQNNTILWIVGIIILIIFLSNYQKPEEGMVGLTPHFYKDGVEVFPTGGLFSIVTGEGITTGNYDQIAFSIYGTNEGNVPITNIQVEDTTTPPEFLAALSSATPQTLAIGETKLLWNSIPMDTVDFESISPVNFYIQLSGEAALDVPTAIYTEDFEGVFPPTSWTTGGDADWFEDTTNSINGVSAGSGDIIDSQNSWLKYSYTFPNDGEISFNWKVSSERNYDYLVFCIDKDPCTRTSYDYRISSASSGIWTSPTLVTETFLVGPHTFTWTFSKDYSVSSGSDMGVIDDILFSEIAGGGTTQIEYSEAYSGDISFVAESGDPPCIEGFKECPIGFPVPCEVPCPLVTPADSFALFDQWYSGYWMGVNNKVFLIFKSGPSPSIEGHSLGSTILPFDNFWNPDGNLIFYGVDVDSLFFWIVKADTSMPYTKHVKFYWRDSAVEYGRFDLEFPLNQDPQGLIVAGGSIYVGDTMQFVPGQNIVFEYDINGNVLNNYMIDAGFRDFAYDGMYFYATNDDGTIKKYDINWNFIEEYNVPSPIANAWGITHDGTYFWIADATDDQRIVYRFDDLGPPIPAESPVCDEDNEISTSYSGSVLNQHYAHDGDWNTYAEHIPGPIPTYGTIQMDYIYPDGATNLIFKGKGYDDDGFYQVQCLDSEGSTSILPSAFQSSTGIETFSFPIAEYCKLSGNKISIQVTFLSSPRYDRFYEGKIEWDC